MSKETRYRNVVHHRQYTLGVFQTFWYKCYASAGWRKVVLLDEKKVEAPWHEAQTTFLSDNIL
jgi:hypothetical protein